MRMEPEKDHSPLSKYLPGALWWGCAELEGLPVVRGILFSVPLQCPSARGAPSPEHERALGIGDAGAVLLPVGLWALLSAAVCHL